MAELKGSDLLKYVDSPIGVYGQVKPTDIVNITFPWKGKKEDIMYIESSCQSCTKAHYDEATNSIKATLTLSKAAKSYEKGSTGVTKDIFVWLNNGQPNYVADEVTLQKKINPEIPYVRLILTGTVVV